MIIRVTAENISKGAIGSASACPLALAFHAAGFDVSVGTTTVDFYNHLAEHVTELPLPAVAQDFQKLFDDGDTVAPFEFEMPELTAGVLPATHYRSAAVV
jgi:hypothetical protein